MFQQLRKYKLITALIMILIGWLIYVFVSRHFEFENLEHEATQDTVFPVSIIYPQNSSDVEEITLPGNVTAWHQSYIYSRVNGYVKMWDTDYGAKVKKGEVMAEILTPALNAEYAQAKADMKAAEAKYELAELTAKRFAAMEASNAVSTQAISVKQADAKAEKAKYEAAQYRVKTFEARIEFKTIVAPFNGVVISRNINVGDYVGDQGSVKEQDKENYLFIVADIQKMRLFVSVPERFGSFLNPSLKAEVRLPQYPNRVYTADFLTVANGFDPNTRTAITEFVLENEDGSIWPGSYANVTLSAEMKNTYLSIPATAMIFDENGTQVAIVNDNNTVRFQTITVQKLNGRTVDISGKVAKTDRIINNPSAALLEGSRVNIVESAEGYFNQEIKTQKAEETEQFNEQ